MNYEKVMIGFYCPKVCSRSPGYEVGSVSPGIWPVAAGVVAARHFLMDKQHLKNLYAINIQDTLWGVPVKTPLLPWGCEACGCSDRPPRNLMGLSFAQTGGTGNCHTGIRMNGTLSAARVRRYTSNPGR